MRDSVVFYRSFYEAVCTLPEEEQLKAFQYIIEYGLYGTEPNGNTASYGLFLMAKPQIDANNKRYSNGAKGGRPKVENQTEIKGKPKDNQNETKTEPNDNQDITEAKPNEKEKVKEKEKDKENIKDSVERTSRFTPPTRQELAAYCEEKGYTLDIDRFLDFYESKGWMIGKNKMKDWRAAVRNWARSRRQELATKGTKFNNFTPRQNDYSVLEEKLLGVQRTGHGGEKYEP